MKGKADKPALRSITILLALAAWTSGTAHAQLTDAPQITEIMAAGGGTLADEDGDAGDWIELYNPAADSVDLDGWYLTDDADDPARWRFPRFVLPPRTYAVVFASGKDRRTVPAAWETLLRRGDTWRYRLGTAEPPPTWADPGFDDATWSDGPSGFGYGDEDDATVVPAVLSVFVRTTFTVESAADVLRAVLHLDYDDAFVAYLNGVEVARANIGTPGVRPAYDQPSDTAIEPLIPRGLPPAAFELTGPATLLHDGENVLAIQLHNASLQSSDLTLVPFLTLGLAGVPADPQGPAAEVAPLLATPLHTDFSLDADGEYLALVEPDGATVASAFDPAFPPQSDGLSYGRTPTGMGYFDPPTPGAPNGTAQGGAAEPPVFSVEHGFFEEPFYLTLRSATPGALLRYTLDGSTPTAAHGTAYEGPILISASSVVRAVAYRDGFADSATGTCTYLFLSDVVAQSPGGGAPPGWPASWGGNAVDYGMDPQVVGPEGSAARAAVVEALRAIPTMSLVTDLPHLFDPETGIYANAWNRGREWERPASLELIPPDGAEGFQVNAGIRIRGGYSRIEVNPKHAFRVFFRSEYGPGKLRYPLFGDEGVDAFDNIDLRTSQNYSWSYGGDARNIMNRDVFSRDLQRDLGVPYTRSRYYHLYLNGQYWGLFQTQERSEASYAASYFGGDPADYDVIKATPDYNIEATDGTLDAWVALWNQANAIADAPTQEERWILYQRAQGLNPDGTRNPAHPVLLDVDNLILYMLAIFLPGNRDAPVTLTATDVNNFYALRDRTGGRGFIFFTHDSEHALLNASENRTGPFPAGREATDINPQWIHQQLTAVDEYRLRFADVAHRLFGPGGALTPAASEARFRSRADEIAQAILGESARWGDAQREPAFTPGDWQAQIDALLNDYFPARSGIVFGQLANARRYTAWRTSSQTQPAPLYPALAAAQFSPAGGTVPAGTALTLSAGADTVYYTLDGADPRRAGGAPAPTAQVYDGAALTLDRRTTVQARAFEGGVWSALAEATYLVDAVAPAAAGLAVTEVHYNPPAPTSAEAAAGFTDNDAFEFIELTHTGTEVLDLTGLHLGGGITFTFGERTLAPGARVLAVHDEAAFALRYGTGLNVAGAYEGRLGNEGDEIVVEHGGTVLHRFTYDDGGSWPGRADGGGSSLELEDPLGDYQDPRNWRPSSEYGGSPGTAGLGPDGRVVVNEVLTHTDPPQTDTIELYNTTGGDLDVSGWFLSDAGDYRKYALPAGTVIAAGGYLKLDESDFNAPADARAFALDSAHGDAVRLAEADTAGNLLRFVDHAGFGATASGEAFGRWPDGVGALYPMTEPTPGAANCCPRVGPVVIREIMYHPVNNDAYLEYLEVYNAGPADEPMAGWHFTDGIAFAFPEDLVLGSGTAVLVVPFDPEAEPDKVEALRTAYGFGDTLALAGPWTGRLDNGGERIELRRPDTPPDDEPDFYPLLLEDRAAYTPTAPWPTEADGTGAALQRTAPYGFGSDPDGWIATSRTIRTEPPVPVDGFEISPLYPNPVTRQAMLLLSVEIPQQVRVTVYDVLGREVRRLYDGALQPARAYYVDFDATSLAGGLYLIRITGERFSETRTAVVAR